MLINLTDEAFHLTRKDGSTLIVPAASAPLHYDPSVITEETEMPKTGMPGTRYETDDFVLCMERDDQGAIGEIADQIAKQADIAARAGKRRHEDIKVIVTAGILRTLSATYHADALFLTATVDRRTRSTHADGLPQYERLIVRY